MNDIQLDHFVIPEIEQIWVYKEPEIDHLVVKIEDIDEAHITFRDVISGMADRKAYETFLRFARCVAAGLPDCVPACSCSHPSIIHRGDGRDACKAHECSCRSFFRAGPPSMSGE